jgi:hypothetical protein
LNEGNNEIETGWLGVGGSGGGFVVRGWWLDLVRSSGRGMVGAAVVQERSCESGNVGRGLAGTRIWLRERRGILGPRRPVWNWPRFLKLWPSCLPYMALLGPGCHSLASVRPDVFNDLVHISLDLVSRSDANKVILIDGIVHLIVNKRSVWGIVERRRKCPTHSLLRWTVVSIGSSQHLSDRKHAEFGTKYAGIQP